MRCSTRLDEDPPDLLVVTGDIVLEDPDDADDREYAHAVLTGAPCPVLAIPGNHDIGFYGEVEERPRRVAAFVRAVGQRPVRGRRRRLASRRRQRVPARRRRARRAGCTRRSRRACRPPCSSTSPRPAASRRTGGRRRRGHAPRSTAATDGADVRLIVSGHRHRSIRRDRTSGRRRPRSSASRTRTAPTRHSARSTTRSAARRRRSTCASSAPDHRPAYGRGRRGGQAGVSWSSATAA